MRKGSIQMPWAVSSGDGDVLPELYALIQDYSATARSGGGAGAYRTRYFTDISTNITGCSLSSNQLTLPDGDYVFKGSLYIGGPNTYKFRLYNITDAAEEGSSGPNGYYAASVSTSGHVPYSGKFSVTGGPKVFEFQHQVETSQAYGMGIAATYGTDNQNASIFIFKIS